MTSIYDPCDLNQTNQTNQRTTVDDLAEVAVTDSSISSQDIAKLVLVARGGCAAAFARVAEWYRPRLIRFLEKRFPTRRGEAEDVAQITLAKAWLKIESFQPDRNFSTWLYTIANRAAIDSLRCKKSIPSQSLSDEQIEGLSVPETDSAAELQEEADNIWATAKEALSERQYALLWLRYAEDLSVQEVAKVLGVTVVSARVGLFRARKIVRRSIESKGSDECSQDGRIIRMGTKS